MAKERPALSSQIGERIALRRRELGWTQEQAAEAAGLSWQFFACVERGIKNMRAESLLKLSRAMNVSVDYILTGEEPDARQTRLTRYTAPLTEQQLICLEEILKNFVRACGHELPKD